MRKMFASLAFASVVAVALVLSPSVKAQDFSPCNTAGPVSACIDFPSPSYGTVVGSANLRFAGWALDTSNGRHVRAISLARHDNISGAYTIVPVNVYWGPRPDVQAAYWWTPIPPEAALGYTVIPQNPEPIGDYNYTLLFSDAPDAQQSASLVLHVVVN